MENNYNLVVKANGVEVNLQKQPFYVVFRNKTVVYG